MNFRISGQKIKITINAKHLGLILDEHLTWTLHMKSLKTKLSIANGLLAKVRYSTSSELLRTIYHALFNSHLRHGCQVWGQSKTQQVKEISILQRKALRILTFNDRYTPAEPLFKEMKILRLNDIIQIENSLLVLNETNNALPEAFNEFFQSANNHHDHNTRDAIHKRINLPQVKTTQYGLNSMKYKSAKDWNNIQQKVTNFNVKENHVSKLKFVNALKIYFFQRSQ